MKAKNSLATGIILGIVGTLLVAIAAWLTVVYTGAYNVAATDEHADIVRWTFETTMHESVARRAQELEAPAEFDAEQVRAGAKTYASTCAHCHGAPGSERESWATRMRPEPPELVEAAAHWSPREVFRIAKHGIKMSGMPAFAPEHSDEELWGLVAFVEQLPGMTPEEYEALAGDATSGGHAHSSASNQDRR